MAHAVFVYKKELGGKVDIALKDDMVSRQSINHRTGDLMGVGADNKVLFLEGSDEAIAKMKELLKVDGIEPHKDQDALMAKLKAEQDAASEGFGAIFG
jgi:hypothetical protein